MAASFGIEWRNHRNRHVDLILLSEPAFIKKKNWHIDVIEAGQHYRITDLDIVLDGALLGRLTEAETAHVRFALKTKDITLALTDVSIELLPRNQWGGIGHMPEMIAAFVQPNEPAVEHLLKKAAEILRRHGKSSALNGYEGGPKRVWELASAIWTAFCSMGLDYSLPPASFEQTGQKIRSPGQIEDSGLATCMDTTLFFCAAMEQSGLNPVIVFKEGHVLAGIWLKPEEFITVVVDDITALRKREKLKELVLFETTLVTQQPCPSFSRAIEMGADHLSEDKEAQFELAIDIRRARLQKIKPLASEKVITPAVLVSEPKEVDLIFEEAPDLPDDEIARQEAMEPAEPKDRLDRWQRKLLDLSLRNSLLNFRPTKRAITIDAPDPGKIEDLLADDQELRLLPRPDLMEGRDLRNQAIYESRTSEDLRRTYALDALNKKELMVGLSKEDLDSRLVELYRLARGSMQEGGANTLFLAMGFLSWTRNEKDNKRHKAPLILVPVILHRRSVRSGFILRLHDDEPRFNPTLLEMLRQDFRLELPVTNGELPKDRFGLDIDGIGNAVERAVKNIRGWEVTQDVVLSTFSFAKYLMWKDLVDRTDQLKQNAVVKHLIDTPRESYSSGGDFADPRTLDQQYGPEQIFCPLSADSSQLSAVIAAAKGKDFVLIGPPGTGKSQTIANLIAHSLAERKSVLFVSEKIAALNVVYRRLREIKLGDFCLELHSNKARKLDVLGQLNRAWEAKGVIDAKEWTREAEHLKKLRDELNEFVAHLHRKRRNGLTAYIAIGRVVAGKEIPSLGLIWSSSESHSEDDLFALEELADTLDINAREVGTIVESPLSAISFAEWSPSWEQSLLNATRVLISAAESLHNSAESFLAAVGITELPLDENRREGLSMLSKILPDAAGRDWRFALRPDARSVAEDLQEGFSLLIQYAETKRQLSIPWSAELMRKVKYGLDIIQRYREIEATLSVKYSNGIAALDVGQLKNDWDKAEKSMWPLSGLRRRRVRRTLNAVVEGEYELELPADIDRLVKLRELENEIAPLVNLSQQTSTLWAGLDTLIDDISVALVFQETLSSAVAGHNWTEGVFEAVAAGRCGSDMAADLERLCSLRHLEKEIAKFEHLHSKTNGLWAGLNTRTEELKKALIFQEALSAAISKIATTAESMSDIKIPLERLLGDGNPLLEETGPVKSAGREYCRFLKHFQEAFESFSKISGTPVEEIKKTMGDEPESIKRICDDILAFKPKLRAWCAWLKVKNEAMGCGLEPLIHGIESGTVELGKVKESFKTEYARWWLNAIVDDDTILREFVSVVHEKRIADFQALDDRLTELTRDYVRAGLCADLPNQKDPRGNSEWGFLRHELQKKRRHVPLRELMRNIPNTITKLAPCLLMSPLSIAQYLTTETPSFDIVVFDEASQIPVWDAIGAIARGKQVVMVGDPKQLPPTSFFDRAESDDDYEDVEGDLESILDECIGSNLPTLNLSWHYRSRHESLITFSNSRYYGGGLVTFPSPNTEDKAVSLHIVEDGVYEKGGARINKPEARALATHIVSRLKDKNFMKRGLTIGVVTFNSEQQRLIEDLLDAERRKSPAIEPFFSDDTIEPIFVKNLESVQGDERDIMYFSVTYGPDLAGAVSMNFGPINKDGGERRLNVAITRARHQLLVFSSLRPEQIDLARTSATGVRDLKHFMEFAERGPKAIVEAVHGTIGDYDSPFEKEVADALKGKGWQVHPQVGVSSFRIDLGVVDPDMPGRYLAGVECDGAMYHRSATARDRDKLRERVLRELGWNIVRIWSTDWWIDAAGSLEKVHSSLEKLLEERRTQRQRESGTHQDDVEIEATEENQELKSPQRNDADFGPAVDSLRSGSRNYEYDFFNNDSDGSSPDNEITQVGAVPKLQQSGSSTDHQTTYRKQEQAGDPPSNTLFAHYNNYEGPPFIDPRKANNIEEITEGLCRIIEVEGPVLAKRAYDIYLRKCGIKRMGRELGHTMNKALNRAVSQRHVIVEDELNTKGFINAIIRIQGTAPVILRERGPRSFEEIPPSEVLVASHLAIQATACLKGSDEHLHAILEMFDLKRLTTQTGAKLLEIIDMEFDYANDWLRKHGIDI